MSRTLWHCRIPNPAWSFGTIICGLMRRRWDEDQGKDRPACLVAASDAASAPRFVIILPITHTPPAEDTVGIEIPAKVKEAIGLDDAPSWVIVSEHNVDEWPNAGLVPVPGRPGVFAYGFIPPSLFARIKAKFLELAHRRRGSGVRRS